MRSRGGGGDKYAFDLNHQREKQSGENIFPHANINPIVI